MAAELRVSSASHPITLQNIRYISRRVIYRSSRPGDCPGELPAQHPRPTFWHPQVYRAAITGIHTDAAGDDRRNLNGEYALVRNTGAAAINLAGWKLSAGDRGQRFSLVRYPLKKGATVRIHTGRGTSRAGHLFLGSAAYEAEVNPGLRRWWACGVAPSTWWSG